MTVEDTSHIEARLQPSQNGTNWYDTWCIQYDLVIKIARRRRENFGGLSLQYLNDLVIFYTSKTIKNLQNLLKFKGFSLQFLDRLKKNPGA